MNQKLSKQEATNRVDEIFSNIAFVSSEEKKPQTVGEYFKKNRKKCLRKF